MLKQFLFTIPVFRSDSKNWQIPSFSFATQHTPLTWLQDASFFSLDLNTQFVRSVFIHEFAQKNHIDNSIRPAAPNVMRRSTFRGWTHVCRYQMQQANRTGAANPHHKCQVLHLFSRPRHWNWLVLTLVLITFSLIFPAPVQLQDTRLAGHWSQFCCVLFSPFNPSPGVHEEEVKKRQSLHHVYLSLPLCPCLSLAHTLLCHHLQEKRLLQQQPVSLTLLQQHNKKNLFLQ